ncbi:WW domain-containing adapter protein with coiled-coil-like [Tubulanus polymorphus]|uniref:WW domain-containing adapter protein with coiled-coil-like n=1 Tax=Tubulanus polymorphus TaxID=672921 RepID=UPI003DA6B39F
MVMHARKHPRLNDGYYDRSESHSYKDKDMDKYPSKSSYNDCDYYGKMRDSPNYQRRDGSPDRSPRYHSKSSYIERTKGKLEKKRSSNSPDRKLNSHGRSSTDKSDGRYHSHYDRNSRDSRESKDRDGRNEKEIRSEIRKSALRICGDWSEHISSSGKRYYYNCISEVSQWERPKEWDDSSSRSSDSNRHKDYSREERDARHQKSSDEYKHSNSERNDGSYASSQQSKQSSSSRGGSGSSKTNSKQRTSRHHESVVVNDDREDAAHVAAGNATGVDQATRPGGYHTSSNIRENAHSDHKSHHISSRDSERTRSLSAQNGGDSNNATTGGLLSQDRRKPDDSEDSKQTEDDMDISPGSTPSNSRPHSRTGTPIVCSNSTSNPSSVPPRSTVATPLTMLPNMTLPPIASALPQLINRMNDSGALQSINHHELTQQALQTLQKLQQALSRQASLAQQSLINQSPRSTEITSPQQTQTPAQQSMFTSPQHPSQQQQQQQPSQQHTPQHQHVPKLAETPTPTKASGDDGGYSPTSDHGEYGNENSPSPSHTSSQGVPVSSLAAAALKPTTCELAPSLRNYYDERLVSHVTGWPSEMYEKQADHYSDEAHNLGSLLSTQVSCDLKKARSLVRITNIQSTLQEQRILFLRQQIEELERMKSGNSFMSS